MKRIHHTWEKWECYPAGFYNDDPPKGMTAQEATEAYMYFLRDLPRFERGLQKVIEEWPRSCEHYLSNENMNRIAWLGQASMCVETGVPACFRGGFNLLSDDEQKAADALALKYLNNWLESKGRSTLSVEAAQSKTKANLY